ncbi:type II toxin-antitoxin system RelE family toxin [Methanobrevibacter sp.]|uniref:type II toxin-antitoxin system RelE family toxin n=1 Tax=Methanobrevibacter sp. TaxID=66852 RepID=UPI00388E213A
MPSENSSKICYELFEDKKAIKFMDKHFDDERLINRIYDKYHRLVVDPYNEAESSFKSRKCPKCMKTRVGSYRIVYFVNELTKEVEIIDIGPRKSIYKKWN